jgi:hypothetical protein
MSTATLQKKRAKPAKKIVEKSAYDDFKNFGAEVYTGMQVGRSHTWHYDRGEWKEKKLAPDRWEISYSVTKRRAGKAPRGSGVPVGTAYHWFILSHQFVEKLNADDYSTGMTGLKLKLAHRRADKNTWNASSERQSKLLVEALEGLIKRIKKNPLMMQIVPLKFTHESKAYTGMAVPALDSCGKDFCQELDVTLNKKHLGLIRFTKNGWRLHKPTTQKLTTVIGKEIEAWYQDNK